MNRRGLLLGAGVLLLGEPARVAYSFLLNNPSIQPVREEADAFTLADILGAVALLKAHSIPASRGGYYTLFAAPDHQFWVPG